MVGFQLLIHVKGQLLKALSPNAVNNNNNKLRVMMMIIPILVTLVGIVTAVSNLQKAKAQPAND